MLGSLLTQWTIRLALACLVAYFAGQLLHAGGSSQTPAEGRRFGWRAISRWIWTLGCVLFIAHVVCAFQFTHHWSHSHAWEHTAKETQRMMGFSFGDGIYFSYFFLLLWVADVACLWLVFSRPRWLIAAAYWFMFFIAFNGAIVFEDGPTRPVGLVVMLLLMPVVAIFVARNAGRLFGRSDRVATAEVEA